MDAIWNDMQLDRPPNASCRVERQRFDGSAFCITIDRIIRDLTSQELLHKEAALLSRLIYRMKVKFRNDKGVKSMSKINRAMLNYLSLSLEKEYKSLKDYVDISDKFVTLPSRQMVEYVLVKTQGFAKLMLRVEEVSKYAAHFLKCRIGFGHAWVVALTAYSVVSRIWLLSRNLVKKSCSWYNDLYSYLKLLKASGLPWLPKEYELPSDLKTWVSVPWIEEPTPSVPSAYGLPNTMFRLIIPREYESDDDPILDEQNYTREQKSRDDQEVSFIEKENIVHSPIASVESLNIVLNDDAGELIDRNSFNIKRAESTSATTKKKNKKLTIWDEAKEKIADNKPRIHVEKKVDKILKKEKNSPTSSKHSIGKSMRKKLLSFDDAKTKSDLLDLLNKESYPGLDKLQWNIIRNKSKKLLSKLEAIDTKQSIIFKKVMKRIKTWIT